MSKYSEFTKAQVPKIDKILVEYIKATSTEETLAKSMNYSIQAGGKRFRPILLLATIQFFGVELTKPAYQVASALEMIHTYSLIHDDLPAMDNDDLRRGKLTNHKVFGEGIAILAGDALLTDAFGLVAQTDLEAELLVELIKIMAVASGSHGMVAGQVADIEGEHKQLPLVDLQYVHQRKTGAIIEFAVKAGTLIAGENDCLPELANYAKHLGIAFQIKDDLLDVEGDSSVIGKNVGMDVELNKSTYPALLGLDGAKRALESEVQQAIASLELVKGHQNSSGSTILEEIALRLLN